MEKLKRKKLAEIPSLLNLATNFEQWGIEFEMFQNTNGERGQNFSWRESIYHELRNQLAILSSEHCSFCDGYPIGETSKETIEHFYPKKEFPTKAYEWENLFYCCDKCQSEANKEKFEFTLKPDESSYSFGEYFYFDLSSGKVLALEHLAPPIYNKANKFLLRYGINNPKRNKARIHLFWDAQNSIKNRSDLRIRKNFKYRYVFDLANWLN